MSFHVPVYFAITFDSSSGMSDPGLQQVEGLGIDLPFPSKAEVPQQGTS
jgi:hypothetical protein